MTPRQMPMKLVSVSICWVEVMQSVHVNVCTNPPIHQSIAIDARDGNA